MAEKYGRTSPTDRGIEQAIVALKKGAHLLRCRRRGKPKFCPFRLSLDEKVLIWYSGEKEKKLMLNSVSKIVPGQRTVTFLRQRLPEKESQSFSLVYQNGQRTLDLICKDKKQADSWFLGLRALLYLSHHPGPLVKQKNSRFSHSCINSPVGHIQRKNRLGLLQDSIKFSQMHSLYGSPWSLTDQYFSESVVDYSDIFYSSRRTLSDTQSILNTLLPPLPHIKSDSFKETKNSNMFKEPRKFASSKIRLSDREASSIDRTHALKDVYIWGEGIEELLGGSVNRCDIDDTKVDVLLPKLLESTRTLDVHNISCGDKHAALVTEHGEVFCWGKENGGRLGHKINMDVSYPKVIESLSGEHIQTIACGVQHTCAVTKSGELYAWGNISYGVCLSGDGDKRSQCFPHKISGPLDGICVSKVACGEWHTAVVSSSGQLFTFGDGTFGALGHGNLRSSCQPKEVDSLKGLRVKSVACGPWHTAAIVEIMVSHFKTNAPCGKLFTWGDSNNGRLGHADRERKLLPTCVASLVDCNFVQVSCGRMLTVALAVNGTVFTMGSSENGQLGNPWAEDTSIATVEGFLTDEFVKEISSGSFHVAVLTTKGRVYTWGKGANGRLGLGDTNDRNSPALVEALEDRHVQSVACGSSFTAAICLHKPISRKDQSICSGCGMAFGFTKKKHNCYSCGLVYCHSCSGRKVTDASLAPHKSKKCRVCDPCFSQLKQTVDTRINESVASPKQPSMAWKRFSDLKIISVEESRCQRNTVHSKLSAQDEIKLYEEKLTTMQRRHLQYQNSLSPFLQSTQRWGQVSCPRVFNLCTKENLPMFGSQPTDYSDTSRINALHSSAFSKFLLPRATSLKHDFTRIDKMLISELKRLHTEVIELSHQCQSNSQKLQHYKNRIGETLSLARDEASKCKAAKDVIKILKLQMTALSERFSSGREMSNAKSMTDYKDNISASQAVRRELSESDNPKLACSSIQLSSSSQIQDEQINRPCDQSAQSSDAATTSEKFNGAPETLTDRLDNVPTSSRDEWVEQDEHGVYLTFTRLPAGQKCLKRVRFGRKHFSPKQAERWWKENQTRICAKYNIERVLLSSKTRSGN